MIKIDKNFNSISCITRLKYQFSKEKSKFTATDIEIFTDLNELKQISQSIIDENPLSTEEIKILPQKRKKSLKDSPKGLPSNEDDVISALASLIHKNQLGKQSLNPKKIFESNLKELIKVVFSNPCKPPINKWKICRTSSNLNDRSSNTQNILQTRSRAVLRLFE